MRADKAVECFNKVLKSMEGPESDPEKYYLYQGLLSIAVALTDLQDNIRILKRNIAQVQTIVKRKSFSTGRWKR